MRPRRRPRLRLTQAACYRVSSSCTLYEVFGNFAWRSAPPRKRVTQSEKAPALRDRECPRPTGLSVDSLLHCNKGNGNGGNSVRKGVSFTPPFGGLYFYSFPGDSSLTFGMTSKSREFVHDRKESARSLMDKTQAFFNQNSPSVARVRHLPHRGRQGERGDFAKLVRRS